MDEQNVAMTYTPTLAERFWRAMGFHSRVPEMSEEGERLPGWIMTHAQIRLSFLDRIRLLISGRALVRMETRTNVPVDHAISASSIEIIRPGARQ